MLEPVGDVWEVDDECEEEDVDDDWGGTLEVVDAAVDEVGVILVEVELGSGVELVLEVLTANVELGVLDVKLRPPEIKN